MAKCLNCGREIGDGAKFCRYCGHTVEEVVATAGEEKTCPQCRRKVPVEAKFCRYCGSKFEGNNAAEPVVPAVGEKTCPQCFKKIPAEAKFCRYCGNEFEGRNVAVTAADKNVTVNENYITWHILPGQLAVKIDETDIADYRKIKGLYVPPRTQAMFFMDGRYVATLESGRYPFKELGDTENADPSDKKRGWVMNFLHNIAAYFKKAVDKLFSGKAFYSFVLVKGTSFPLIFTLNDVLTGSVHSQVGLHLLCSINDLNAFYADHLADKKFVSIEAVAARLLPGVKAVLNRTLSSVMPHEIGGDPKLMDSISEGLRARFGEIYPYITITQIIELTASHAELEKIGRLKEELYIAEQELEQRQLREDFLNKIQNADYSNALRSARSRVDFEALMDEIDESGMLNEEKKAQFVLMLQSERLLREARTEAETQNAIDGLLKSRLLSAEEVETLRREIAHRADMQNISDEAAIAMATLQNAEALDREKLAWEMEIGNKRFRNELEQQRLSDEYADERRNADFEFQNRQMASKMDLLRQAQALREEREQAQHMREMEARKLEQEAELEHYRITATMSFEQIMASNPDITPEAAAALAKKYEAEALAAQNDRTSELVKQHDQDLKEILSQQMNLTRDIIAAQNQANSNAVAEKQRELDRVHADAEHHQDRMLSGMQTTVEAVSSMGRPQVAPCFCPSCGRKNSIGAKKCEQCGEDLE